MKPNRFTISLVILLMIVGCVTRVPHSSVSEDAAAKTFQTTPKMANLYVYREPRFYGSKVGWDVAVDGRTLGVLTSGTYIFREVEPGRHILSRLQIVKPIYLAAGRNYFFRIDPSFAESMTKFVEVSEQGGRAAVSKLPRVTTLY
jgi:hypothetical protein